MTTERIIVKHQTTGSPWTADAALVCRHPGLTLAELADIAGAGDSDRTERTRQRLRMTLPAARAASTVTCGPPRPCRIQGLEAQTWWPAAALRPQYAA